MILSRVNAGNIKLTTAKDRACAASMLIRVRKLGFSTTDWVIRVSNPEGTPALFNVAGRSLNEE